MSLMDCPMLNNGLCEAKKELGFKFQKCLHLLVTRCRFLPDDIDHDFSDPEEDNKQENNYEVK